MQGSFSVVSVLGWMPDAVSIAIRNCSGAAYSTGCVVGSNDYTNEDEEKDNGNYYYNQTYNQNNNL
jgi:hypothetical protein